MPLFYLPDSGDVKIFFITQATNSTIYKILIMLKKIIVLFIILALAGTVAYEMGWLSRKGKKAYKKTKETVIEKSEKVIDKTRDAVK